MQDASWLHLNYAGLYKTISSIVIDMHEYYEQSANQISLPINNIRLSMHSFTSGNCIILYCSLTLQQGSFWVQDE